MSIVASLVLAAAGCGARSAETRQPNMIVTAWIAGPDSFNPLTGWVDADVIGIDLGITMLMAENYRSQLIWNTFMTNPEITNAMTQVGFQTT